jgi:lipid-binding SYLF domain-containing protein
MNRIAKWCMPLLALIVAMTANAASREEEKVAAATDVVEQLSRIPEQTIPPSLLARAYAIAVIPNVGKGAFILGYQRGKGVLVVRRDDNTWSNPSFIRITSGSFGWQWGGQSSDIILVFKTRQGVENIQKGKLTLGADAAVAAGPVGRRTAAATDIELKAEVYSYSRSRGFFAGVALEGSALSIDAKANSAYYGTAGISVEDAFAGRANLVPDTTNTFVQVLSSMTMELPTKPGMSVPVTAEPDTAVSPPPSKEVKTYGIGEHQESDGAADDENWQD